MEFFCSSIFGTGFLWKAFATMQSLHSHKILSYNNRNKCCGPMKNPMKKSTSFPIPVMPLFSVLCFFLLLTFPKLSIEGARDGLLLWFQNIVPTLFPFLICSGLVTSMGGISYLVKPIYPVFHTFFGMSESGIYTFLLGIFCGFPMGAKTCRDLLEGGALSPKEAKCLMAVCNQPSSMFLLGYTASALHNGISIKLILFCLYLPLIPLWFLARKFYHLYANKAVTASAHITAPYISPNTPTNTPKPPLSLDHMILSSMELLIRIGGYLMIFSVISLFIRRFPSPTPMIPITLLTFTEITCAIQTICTDTAPPLQGLLVTASLAFGGLSCLFQVKSALSTPVPATGPADPGNSKRDSATQNPSSLSIRHYLFWKLIHTGLATGLFLAVRAWQKLYEASI